MIERHAGRVRGLKDHRLVVKLLRPLGTSCRVGARRGAGVHNARSVIEHEAPGALEEHPLPFVVSQIEEMRDPEAQLLDDRLDHRLAALGPAARACQRIEDQRAVLMEAHPVVGE